MTKTSILTAGVLALSLTACGGSQEPAPTNVSQPTAASEMSAVETMDHTGHDMSSGTMGHGTGVIKSVGSQSDFLTIDHGPIDGIGMGAMTMGFDIMDGVAVSGFAEGDEVAFMVKKGRDNSYRITAICDTGSEGADCLDGMMDH
jgi:Cu(I)/Ag(I) efflux system protein CusF